MIDPVKHARMAFEVLPDDPDQLTTDDLSAIRAALEGNVRLGTEIRTRQEKLARAVLAGDRSSGAIKRLKKIDRQLARLFTAEEQLQPFVDRAMEIEADLEGPVT